MRTAGHDRWAIRAATQNSRDALFQRLQEADEVADLTGIQPKLRHPWVTGRQPFAERFFQRFDRVAFMESSKWRRGGAMASGRSVDRMTRRTIGLRKGFSASDAFHVGMCGKARDDVGHNQYRKNIGRKCASLYAHLNGSFDLLNYYRPIRFCLV